MKLSVVVPAVDEASTLPAALARLASLRKRGHEVLVVDGGSRDETCGIASRFADRVLVSPRGRAVQMNTGASVATGTTLLFLHADCRLPDGALAAIEGAHAAGYRWGRFDVSLEGRSRWLPIVAATMNQRSALTGICTGDQAMFVEREAFETAGGFPPIALMEDVALSRTLKSKAGPPKRVRQRVVASGRRWDTKGALRTIATMASLRFAYWRGADPSRHARRDYGLAPAPAATLQVFAKSPVPGFVKTRLAATIGNDAAAAVYRDLVLRTLGVATAARKAGIVGSVELWLAPEAQGGTLAEWAVQHELVVKTQRGVDLGARMRHALRESLAAGRPALLIGTDVPAFDLPYLARAAAALQSHDAVIGPAEDGGYVLVGLARDIDLFEGVQWSTADVMTQTRELLRSASASWSELPTLWDIDTHDDLVRWRAAGVDPVAPRP